jgi:hypothetical protein
MNIHIDSIGSNNLWLVCVDDVPTLCHTSQGRADGQVKDKQARSKRGTALVQREIKEE